MAANEILNAMESLTFERDRQEFALGDTLDIKTGLILAALTFLAIQSTDLVKGGLSFRQEIVQFVSVIAMIVGGAFCAAELWPRDYAREAPPSKYQDWIEHANKLHEENPQESDPVTVEALTSARISSALTSVQTNLAINKLKSKLMIVAFFGAIAAFAANVATLAIRLF
jgi:hypothetical protein